jgi:hypothetical protein
MAIADLPVTPKRDCSRVRMPRDELANEQLGRVRVLVRVREVAAVRVEELILGTEEITTEGNRWSHGAVRCESREVKAREQLHAADLVKVEVETKVLSPGVRPFGLLEGV